MTTLIFCAVLLAMGAAGGFVVAWVFRPRRAQVVVPVAARARASAMILPDPAPDDVDDALPSLVPLSQQALIMPMLVQYDPDKEDEDDIPTTLYRRDDEDVEALLAEFDPRYDER